MVCQIVSDPRCPCVDEALVSVAEIAIAKGTTRVRLIKYARRHRPHKCEILVAIIGIGAGEHLWIHTYGWAWRPEYWDEFVRLLARQAGDDTPLTEDDVVKLVKLRLESVRETRSGNKPANRSDLESR